MKYLVSKELMPFISKPLEDENISYSIERIKEEETGFIIADISARAMKKIRRKAWAGMLSEMIHLPVLSREDIRNKRTGVVPEKEMYWFKKSFL